MICIVYPRSSKSKLLGFCIQSGNDLNYFYDNFVFFLGSSSSDSEVTTSPSDNSSSFVRHNNICVVRVQYERLYLNIRDQQT